MEIKVTVDKLPEKCRACTLYVGGDFFSYCAVKSKGISIPELPLGRPDWCPLLVEEVCEWRYVYYVRGDDYNYESCQGYSSMKYKNEYKFCPNCGKKINYKE